LEGMKSAAQRLKSLSRMIMINSIYLWLKTTIWKKCSQAPNIGLTNMITCLSGESTKMSLRANSENAKGLRKKIGTSRKRSAWNHKTPKQQQEKVQTLPKLRLRPSTL
jgi:hypothetical protein